MNYFRVLTGILVYLSVAFLTNVGVPTVALAHEEESRVALELESPAQVRAGAVVAEFQLVDTKENKVLTLSDLNVTHERRLHFLAYDPALKEFQHVHPEFDRAVWRVELNFGVNGNYFICAQGELSSDSEEFSALSRIKVSGGAQEWPAPVLSDDRSGSESGSVATISNQRLRAGKMAMLTLKFTRVDGSAANITPYLGAFAHVISTPEDGDSLIHVHPMNGGSPSEGMLHVTFPRAGFYRVWVQFIDAGILRTVPLSIEVTK
jgi:hypothetical protein